MLSSCDDINGKNQHPVLSGLFLGHSDRVFVISSLEDNSSIFTRVWICSLILSCMNVCSECYCMSNKCEKIPLITEFCPINIYHSQNLPLKNILYLITQATLNNIRSREFKLHHNSLEKL